MADHKVVDGVMIGGDRDKVEYRTCPHCGVDLTDGVAGMVVQGFEEKPDVATMKFSPSPKAMKTPGAVVIDCPKCHRHLQMTGVFAQMWYDHKVLDEAKRLLMELGAQGFVPTTLQDKWNRVLQGDVYDVVVGYAPVDMNGVPQGTFKTYDEAYAEMASHGWADVRPVKTHAQVYTPQVQDDDPYDTDDEEGDE